MGICIDRYVLLKVKSNFFDSYLDNPSSFNKLITPEDKVEELVGTLFSSHQHYIRFSYCNIQVVFFDTLLGRGSREYRTQEDLREILSKIPDKDDIYLIIDTWKRDNSSSYSRDYIIWIGIGFSNVLANNIIQNIQAIGMGFINDVTDLDLILDRPYEDHFKLYQDKVEYSLSKVGIVHV